MIRFFSKQRIQERFASRLVAAAVGLNRNKHSINLGELFRSSSEEPTGDSIRCPYTECRDSLRDSSRPIRRLFVPRHGKRWHSSRPARDRDQTHKRSGTCSGCRTRVKGLAGAAAAVHIKDVGDVKPSRPHQLPNITIRRKILLIVFEPAFLIAVGSGQLVDLRFGDVVRSTTRSCSERRVVNSACTS